MASRLVWDAPERGLLSLAERLGVSRKRLLGWEPRERHEHYDADGNLTGVTITNRESEWDDRERKALLALERYRGQLCEYGHHPDLSEDESLFWTFENGRCSLCAASAKYGRIMADVDDRAVKMLGEDPSPHLPRPGDGRSVFLRLMSPTEVTARQG